MARILTEDECKKIEWWARATKLSRILTFFESLPREIHFPRPTLIGSNNAWEILFDGFSTTSQVIGEVRNLDEPFNRHLVLQKTKLSQKRDVSIGSPMGVVYNTLRKGLDRVCLLEGHGECSETIVRAHSLQKSRFKKYSTSDGHVYEFDPFSAPQGPDKIMWPSRIGINEATTFTGFCSRHDSETFAPIETRPYEGTDEQKFLFHYRAVAQAYYSRAHKMKIIKAAYEDLVKKVQPSETKWFVERLRLNDQDIRDIEWAKQRYDSMLWQKQFPQIASFALTTNSIPDILATDFFGPSKDFEGQKIQHAKTNKPLNWVSLTITVADDRGLVLLCAEPTNPQFERLRRTLYMTPRSNKTMTLVTYVVCQFENFIMLPKWWESLSLETQRTFTNARAAGYFPRELPSVCDWELS